MQQWYVRPLAHVSNAASQLAKCQLSVSEGQSLLFKGKGGIVGGLKQDTRPQPCCQPLARIDAFMNTGSPNSAVHVAVPTRLPSNFHNVRMNLLMAPWLRLSEPLLDT